MKLQYKPCENCEGVMGGGEYRRSPAYTLFIRLTCDPRKAHTRFSRYQWKLKKFKSRHHLTTGKLSRHHPLSATHIQLIHGFPSNFWHRTLKTINCTVHIGRKCVVWCSIVETLKFYNICGIDIYYYSLLV